MADELRVLHVIPNLVKGGAQRLAIDICNEINKRENISVKLAVLNSENEFRYLTQELEIVECDSSIKLSIKGKSIVNSESFDRLVEDFDPHVIHSHLYLAEIVSRENGQDHRLYVTHCHNNIPQFSIRWTGSFNIKKLVTNIYERRRIMNKYSKVNNLFLAISKDTERYLERVLSGKLSKRIVYFPNAFAYSKFENPNRHISSIGPLINVGNFLKNKNQQLLIDILAMLRTRGLEKRLLLVGDGVLKEEVLSKASRFELLETCEFLGSVDNVEEYLWRSSIYVHVARYEQFGLVLLEAMAAGLPVVTLDGGGNKDLIEEGKNGFIVKSEDPSEFADRIIDLLENEDKYKEMSRYARCYAKQYDIEPYVDRLLALYRSRLPNIIH